MKAEENPSRILLINSVTEKKVMLLKLLMVGVAEEHDRCYSRPRR
jgi:hypothetical protein